MTIQPIGALSHPLDVRDVDARRQVGATNEFGAALASAIDRLDGALGTADGLAALAATGGASIESAAIARAHADVMLETAAVGAGRLSSALTSILQTQV